MYYCIQKPSELEGFYRFINSPSVTLSKLLAPPIAQTVSKMMERANEDNLVVHDTTEISPVSKGGAISEFQHLGKGQPERVFWLIVLWL
jgi:hypothetical protein